MSDHKKRIDELQKEGTALLEKRQQAATAITQIDNRVAEIRGALKELDLLSKPEVKPDAKPEEPKK